MGMPRAETASCLPVERTEIDRPCGGPSEDLLDLLAPEFVETWDLGPHHGDVGSLHLHDRDEDLAGEKAGREGEACPGASKQRPGV